MNYKLLTEKGSETYALIFDPGDEVLDELESFASKKALSAGHFTAIGAFSRVKLGFFNFEKQDYEEILIDEQVEVLALTGDIALLDNSPKIHAHVVVGKRNGTAHGGHLLSASVQPTLELILEETPAHLIRRMDPSTGLPLVEIDD
ncbi:MAG: DNA-binding protein [Saprospiraceae bacterium]|nr:DNA-binding protein [Saprospiraceae bacterium]MCB0622630.1 DNA-binding protein [Saprospiraceae bacterium]MCB0678331.1 DNA-binding protein [Saprospiraceae bacterium]MCB0680214.1 DNA-binding protein [Saprospiraceae bacterium]